MHMRLIALTALLLIPASCAGLIRQEPPDRKSYALQVERAAAPMQQPVFDESLAVRRFSVEQIYSQRYLLYRMDETEFKSDYYNLFLIDPGELITEQTRQWLTQANLFKAVIPPESMIEAAYVLEGHVLDLYGDFTSGKGAAVLAIQFILVRDTRGTQDILLNERYEKRMPLDERSPAGLVRGYNEALASILMELEQNMYTFAL